MELARLDVYPEDVPPSSPLSVDSSDSSDSSSEGSSLLSCSATVVPGAHGLQGTVAGGTELAVVVVGYVVVEDLTEVVG